MANIEMSQPLQLLYIWGLITSPENIQKVIPESL